MKKITILLLFLFVLPIVSCSSDSDDNNPTNPNNPQPATPGFVWRENSTTAPANTAGSAEVRTQFNSIFAFEGATPTSGTVFEMNLSAVTPGTYAIGGSNAFYFNGNTAVPTSGTVTITSNAAGKASGTFEAVYPSGTVTSVYGTFTDIPVN